MSQESNRNDASTKEEIKYDNKWKQNIQLSDDEGSQGQIILVSSDDDQQESQINNAQQEMIPIGLQPQTLSLSDLQPLVYLDEPGLQMYVSQDPDISALLQCFLPKALFELFQQNVNQNLFEIIRNDYPSEQQSQVIFAKKRFGDQEVPQYLGASILFGVFRFPTVNHYWHADGFLKGGIEICIQEGRYKFIDRQLMIFPNESEQQKALHLTAEIRKKWKKMYRPDQELILYPHGCSTHTTYHLLDSETLFILDEVVLFQEQSDAQVFQMIQSFGSKNHILYFQTDALSLRVILKLLDCQIYPVGEFSISKLDHDEESRMFLAQFTEDDQTYCNERVCFVKRGQKMLVFPRKKVKLEGDQSQLASERYEQQLNFFLEKAQKRILFIDIYKCPFSYSSQMNTLYQRADDDQLPLPSLNYVRILFEEFFEGTIYNMFSFFNSILINNHQRQNYKQFKLAVAGALVGEKFTQLERDRRELKRREVLQVKEVGVQTEKLSFGLPRVFDTREYHLPVQEERSFQVKYCVVCMKYENLSKSYFNCMECYRQFGQRVFLCVFPCFELFHRNPTQFIECEASLVQKVKDDKYFKVEYKITFDGDIGSHYDRGQQSIEKPLLNKDLKLPPPPPANLLQRAPLRNNPNTAAAMAARPNARTAPQHYNWSYNRGFRRKGDEDDPIEKDFEELINNLNQQSVDLLTRPQQAKNTAMLNTQNAQYMQNRLGKVQSEQISAVPPPVPPYTNIQPVFIQNQLLTYFNNMKQRNVQLKQVIAPINKVIPPLPEPKQMVSTVKEKKDIQKLNLKMATAMSMNEQQEQQPRDEASFKSPFEKFMEQVKKKTQVDRSSKLEAQQD